MTTQMQEKLIVKIDYDYLFRLQLYHARYEYVRRLNTRQFAELYQRNIRGEGAFDDLVDRLIKEGK